MGQKTKKYIIDSKNRPKANSFPIKGPVVIGTDIQTTPNVMRGSTAKW